MSKLIDHTLFGETQNPQRIILALHGMKFCLSGGAPLPNEVKRGFEQRTGATVGEAYGQTETSPVVTCNPLIPASIKTGSVGVPIPGTVVEIVSTEDGRTVLPAGARGEVCVRGPQVMAQSTQNATTNWQSCSRAQKPA